MVLQYWLKPMRKLDLLIQPFTSYPLENLVKDLSVFQIYHLFNFNIIHCQRFLRYIRTHVELPCPYLKSYTRITRSKNQQI